MRLNTEPLQSYGEQKSKLEAKEQVHKFRIINSIFPNVNKQFLKQKVSELTTLIYSMNQFLYSQGQQPQFVFYLIEGEARIEDTYVCQRQTNQLMQRINVLKSRVLLIISTGSLIGMFCLDDLIQQTSKVMCNIQNAYSSQKNSGEQSPIAIINSDGLLKNRVKQIQKIQKNLDLSPERQQRLFNKPPLPITINTIEHMIVTQNYVRKELNLAAPLYQTPSRSRINRVESADKNSNRSRSISAPIKQRTFIKQFESVMKIQLTTKKDENYQNFVSVNCNEPSRTRSKTTQGK